MFSGQLKKQGTGPLEMGREQEFAQLVVWAEMRPLLRYLVHVQTSPGMTLARLMHGDIVHEKRSTVMEFDFHLLLCWFCDTNNDICDEYAKSE